MPTDGRVSAWLSAWQTVEAARKLHTDHKGVVRDPLPAVYWGLVAEAQVYTALATAPEDIGVAVGDWFQSEQERKQQSREQAQEFLRKIESRFADGHA